MNWVGGYAGEGGKKKFWVLGDGLWVKTKYMKTVLNENKGVSPGK